MTQQQRPSWVTGVAITAIIFSCFGLINGAQEIVMPQMLDAQKEMMQTVIDGFTEELESQNIENNPEAREAQEFIQSMFGMLNNIFDLPQWYQSWLVMSGILSLLINGFYLFAAIWLLQLRPPSVALMYVALPLSIILGIVKLVMAHRALSGIAFLMMSGSIIAIVIELVLLIVLLAANKAAFKTA